MTGCGCPKSAVSGAGAAQRAGAQGKGYAQGTARGGGIFVQAVTL